MEKMMKKINFERVKTYFLIFLIITSVFLTGSLWFDNYEGAFAVVEKVASKFQEKFNDVKYTEVYDQLIQPYKVIVNTGDQNHYIYYANDESSKTVWNLSKQVLANNVTGKKRKAIVDKPEWESLFDRQTVVCEFAYPINKELLKSLCNVSKEDNELPERISGIAFTKTLEGGLCYIKEKNDKGEEIIHKYYWDFNYTDFENYITTCTEAKNYSKYMTLAELGTSTFIDNKTIAFEKDIMLPVAVNKQEVRKQVERIKIDGYFDVNDDSEINKLVMNFLDTNDVSKFTTNDGGIIFTSENKDTVTINSNGYIEFIAKKKDIVNEGNVLNNFNDVIKFLRNNGDLKDELYLLGNAKEDKEYVFYFGINYEGIPIIMDNNPVNENELCLLEIRASAGEITLYKKIDTVKDKENGNIAINLAGSRVLDDLLPLCEAESNIEIDELVLAYKLNDESKTPYWYTRYLYNDVEGHILVKTSK